MFPVRKHRVAKTTNKNVKISVVVEKTVSMKVLGRDRQEVFDLLDDETFKDCILRDFSTCIEVVIVNELVTISLAAISSEDYEKTMSHIFKHVRPLQRYTLDSPNCCSSAWKNMSDKNRINFQAKYQVTIDYENANHTKLIMKSFTSDRLATAICKDMCSNFSSRSNRPKRWIEKLHEKFNQ